MYILMDIAHTATELFQSLPFRSGTVFRSIHICAVTSHLLHSLEDILLRTVLFIKLLSCLQSDIVILDMLILLTYLLTYHSDYRLSQCILRLLMFDSSNRDRWMYRETENYSSRWSKQTDLSTKISVLVSHWNLFVLVCTVSSICETAQAACDMYPLHFLARCRKRRLNQALSVLFLSIGFFWVCFLLFIRATFYVPLVCISICSVSWLLFPTPNRRGH